MLVKIRLVNPYPDFNNINRKMVVLLSKQINKVTSVGAINFFYMDVFSPSPGILFKDNTWNTFEVKVSKSFIYQKLNHDTLTTQWNTWKYHYQSWMMLFKECNVNLSKAVPKLSPNVSTRSYFIDYATHFSYRMHHQYSPKNIHPKILRCWDTTSSQHSKIEFC